LGFGFIRGDRGKVLPVWEDERESIRMHGESLTRNFDKSE
jgi:hypothetical protein